MTVRGSKKAPMRKRKPVRKGVTKQKRNPVAKGKIAKAIDLYYRFRDQEPKFIDEYKYATPKVAIYIGECDAVEYTTIRAGKKELYRHEFGKKSRPKLCSSFDGKVIFFLGGRYNFTEDGIVDRK